MDIGKGELNIIIYPDSSVNLLNAIKRDSVSDIKKTPEAVEAQSKTNEPSISIDNLSISDLYMQLTNSPENRESSVLIKNFDSKFDFQDGKANLKFSTSILIEKFKVSESNFITNQEINLDIISNLDKQNGLQIEDGKLYFANSTFHFKGNFNPLNEGDLNLKIVSDGSLNILSLFVNDKVAKNLNKGEFYFFGFVDGKTFTEFPLIDIDFGFKDVELVNPITNRTIKNLNFKGGFHSGRNKNLSEAVLKIDTLYADFPDGHINLTGSVNNFMQPEIDFDLFLDADVTGLDDVIKLGSIDSLNGRITLTNRFKGDYNISEKRLIGEINKSEISFQNFGIIIPGTIRFYSINGKIIRNGDKFSLENINIKSEKTDFNINGEIENIQYLIFNIEKEIKANLAIKSSV
ncbi:MAG TPA: hypothetical protein VIY47_14770, partial [Ignavibacteriaceae bacterium]